jgi:4-oxalocrotonate tautomerase
LQSALHNAGSSKKKTGNPMPLLSVKLIEGVFTPAQKREMVRNLTETMVAIEGENLRPYTVVVVERVKSGDWRVGGDCLTADDARALAVGHSKRCA